MPKLPEMLIIEYSDATAEFRFYYSSWHQLSVVCGVKGKSSRWYYGSGPIDTLKEAILETEEIIKSHCSRLYHV